MRKNNLQKQTDVVTHFVVKKRGILSHCLHSFYVTSDKSCVHCCLLQNKHQKFMLLSDVINPKILDDLRLSKANENAL